VLRRLFQRFEQRIEGRTREAMHFVDNVDLVARRDRGVADRIDDLTDIVDAGVAGGALGAVIVVGRFGLETALLVVAGLTACSGLLATRLPARGTAAPLGSGSGIVTSEATLLS
jgi:hypothetical protein